MEFPLVQRAIDAARSAIGALGFDAGDGTVIHNSDRIAVRFAPCNILARIAPQAWEEGLQFEADVAHRLGQIGAPVGTLEPRAGPCVYVRDTFALTLWTFYDQAGDVAPADYAAALMRLHASLRQIDGAAPHVAIRIAGWAEELRDQQQTPELPAAERELLSTTFGQVQTVMNRWERADQVLHGEPHPGNLLATSSGPRFIDFHTCQRGPVEYDIAFLPEDAAAHYPGANHALVRQLRALMWAGFTTMRWRHRDQFPNRDYWRAEGMDRLRAALARA